MSVYRTEKTRNFTIMSNHHLRNKGLSFKAMGILSVMLSLPDDWIYTVKGLAKIAKDGVASIRAGLEELEAEGYLVRRQPRDEKGMYSKIVFDIYEIPRIATPNKTVEMRDEVIEENVSGMYADIADNIEAEANIVKEPVISDKANKKIAEQVFEPFVVYPSTELPLSGNPLTENRTQLNTNILNTDKQNTYIQKTIYPIDPISIHTEIEDRRNIRIIEPLSTLEEYKKYKELIKSNIRYDDFVHTESDMGEIDEIVEIMTETIAFNRNPLNINGCSIPAEVVKSRFLKINHADIDYITFAMSRNCTKVRNIRKYLITAIFNAKSTQNCYYGAEVRYDMYGS